MKISDSSKIPSSVYRLQLNDHFKLRDAIKILPYLKELGLEGLYTSPYYDSYSYGYDVTDPNRLNPALGTKEEYKEFCALLQKLGLKQILDVVPNHMGIKGGKNRWWQDVLENGPYSAYALFFDINWSPDKRELQDRILLPILGETYGKILEHQKIQLHFREGRFVLHYSDYPLPVAPHTYPLILGTDLAALKKRFKKNDPDLKEYLDLIEFYQLFPLDAHERVQKKKEGRERLARLCARSLLLHNHVARVIALLNGKKGIPASFDRLDRLLRSQFYCLTYWKVAIHEINYRRFFNINELAAIRIENPKVLKKHHKWVFELIRTGKVQGLRIDHPDGLYDPDTYFDRLRERGPLYTVVEKILNRHERLPDSWQVEGTEGYDYLNLVNGLFVFKPNEKAFTKIYEEFIGAKSDFDAVLYEARKYFAFIEMASEVEALAFKLERFVEHTRYYCDFTRDDLTTALSEVIACFPVYRTYIAPKGKANDLDRRIISIAIRKARQRAKYLDPSIFDFLKNLLLVELKHENEAYYREWALRFQQLTAPIMAKGLEDTTYYIYNRFISLNEVGGDPTCFGHTIAEFHQFNLEKRKKWPFGFLAASTHDSKRSEDVRMRLNVLSEIPARWRHVVNQWAHINRKIKKRPSPNLEYFIYQTLVGVWPNRPLKKGEWTAFTQRIWESILKSMREAKRETSWFLPDLKYENDVHHFFFSILTPQKNNLFLKHFLPFQKEIDAFGMLNSLSAIVLRLTSCGVSTLYQGNELWNYTLVDPDNRRKVDYVERQKMLAKVKGSKFGLELKQNERDQLKLYILWKGLNFRRAHKKLLLDGDYIPLEVTGKQKGHVVAFMRKFKRQKIIVLVGCFYTLQESSFGETERVVLPPTEEKDKKWQEIFTGRVVSAENVTLSVGSAFKTLPVAILVNWKTE